MIGSARADHLWPEQRIRRGDAIVAIDMVEVTPGELVMLTVHADGAPADAARQRLAVPSDQMIEVML